MASRASLFTLLLLLASQLSAQSGIGIKAGGHMSTLHSEAFSNDLLPGGSLGLYFPIGFGHRWELQPEVQFSAQGSTQEVSEAGRQTLRLYYAQAPMNAKFFVTPTVNLLGGIQLGYLASASALEKGSSPVDVTEDFNRMDIDIVLGLGVGTPSGWDFSLRYTSGMTNVLKDDDVFFPTNRVYSISIGHRIRKLGILTRKRR